MARRDWYDVPSTVSPISASVLNDLEARKPEIATFPINVLDPPYNMVVDDLGAGARAQNVQGLNAAIAQANIDKRMIQLPPNYLYFTAGATITTLALAPGFLGTPFRTNLQFDKDGDCIVMKGNFKVVRGIYLNNVSGTHTARDAVLRIKNCAYGNFTDVYAATDGPNSTCIMLEEEYTGTTQDAIDLVHLGCWYNTFRNVGTIYLNSAVYPNTGYGLSFETNANAIGVVNPVGQPPGTYSGQVSNNVVIGLNSEGKDRCLNISLGSRNVFMGGQFIGGLTHIYGRNSWGNSFIGIGHSQYTTLFDLAVANCGSNLILNPQPFLLSGLPWSLGTLGYSPLVLATDETATTHGLTLNDCRIRRVGTNVGAVGNAQLGQNANGSTWAEFRQDGSPTYALLQNSSGFTRINAASGQELALDVNEVDKIRASNTGVAVNGNSPVAKAGAITAPTTPSAGYVQAEAASMKTAVDAIRTALTNFGITA